MKNERAMKRLTIDDRMVIQACLLEKMSITENAARLHVHKSTVSRELKNNSIHKKGNDVPCVRKFNGLCNKCPINGRCPREKIYYNFTEAKKNSRRKRSLPRSTPKLPNPPSFRSTRSSPKGRLSASRSTISTFPAPPCLLWLPSKPSAGSAIRAFCRPKPMSREDTCATSAAMKKTSNASNCGTSAS